MVVLGWGIEVGRQGHDGPTGWDGTGQDRTGLGEMWRVSWGWIPEVTILTLELLEISSKLE